ncbi:9966_t:CDS:2 [Funneliformis caledonium]|uniref:9966_t:CDS:1 n=1 Tax=Funneliformis caledonium TaxID=1117310 RepID=A0A9N9DE08_9GLOM|nr:9966_t:CDS:2 [Funneliformis caledonium]
MCDINPSNTSKIIMKIHIFMLIIVILAFSNIAFSAPSSSEKHSSLVKRQEECTCAKEIFEEHRWWCCDSGMYSENDISELIASPISMLVLLEGKPNSLEIEVISVSQCSTLNHLQEEFIELKNVN